MKAKTMIFATIVILLITFGGCKETKIQYSKVLTESAEVVDLVYTPSNHGGGAGPSFGMTSGGDLAVGIATVSVDISEKYAVVFQCQHGKFIIESDQKKTKDLWNRLKEGQKVTVYYREVYKNIYEDSKMIESHLVKYQFLDAK